MTTQSFCRQHPMRWASKMDPVPNVDQLGLARFQVVCHNTPEALCNGLSARDDYQLAHLVDDRVLLRQTSRYVYPAGQGGVTFLTKRLLYGYVGACIDDFKSRDMRNWTMSILESATLYSWGTTLTAGILRATAQHIRDIARSRDLCNV